MKTNVIEKRFLIKTKYDKNERKKENLKWKYKSFLMKSEIEKIIEKYIK